jgi:hypothetical protein
MANNFDVSHKLSDRTLKVTTIIDKDKYQNWQVQLSRLYSANKSTRSRYNYEVISSTANYLSLQY